MPTASPSRHTDCTRERRALRDNPNKRRPPPTSGKPIKGIEIGIYGPAQPQSSAAVQSAATGGDGTYELCVPPGRQYLYVMGTPGSSYEAPRQGLDIEVAENATETRDFALTPSIVQNLKPIRGHVVGPDGKPVAKAKVLAAPVGMDPGLDMGNEIETDDHGDFTAQLPYASVRLRARRGALATAKGNEKGELQGYLKAHGLTYPVAIDAEDPHVASFGQTMSGYGVFGIPTIAVLDRKGVVRYLDFGLDGAMKVVGELLASE